MSRNMLAPAASRAAVNAREAAMLRRIPVLAAETGQ
jgi:hypothetical protein